MTSPSPQESRETTADGRSIQRCICTTTHVTKKGGVEKVVMVEVVEGVKVRGVGVVEGCNEDDVIVEVTIDQSEQVWCFAF